MKKSSKSGSKLYPNQQKTNNRTQYHAKVNVIAHNLQQLHERIAGSPSHMRTYSCITCIIMRYSADDNDDEGCK